MNKPNVLFILVDTLRADRLGCYGYNKNTSPNIDSIANKGILFNKAFCCINLSSPSLTSIFSGLYPTTHGILRQGMKLTREDISYFENSKIKLLPEILKEEGYKTYGLDWFGGWHKKGYDYYEGSGIDLEGKRENVRKVRRFLDKIKMLKIVRKIYNIQFMKKLFSRVTKTQFGNIDSVLTNTAVKLIKGTDMPFFLFFHYIFLFLSFPFSSFFYNLRLVFFV